MYVYRYTEREKERDLYRYGQALQMLFQALFLRPLHNASQGIFVYTLMHWVYVCGCGCGCGCMCLCVYDLYGNDFNVYICICKYMSDLPHIVSCLPHVVSCLPHVVSCLPHIVRCLACLI